jgi:hypothetical protein
VLRDSECLAVPEAARVPARPASAPGEGGGEGGDGGGPFDLCLAVLAYEGWTTISNTLASWAAGGLLAAAQERFIFIQGPPHPRWNAHVQALAREYGFVAIVSQKNIMFDSLFELNAACTTSTHFLFLEEDWALAPGVGAADVRAQLASAVDLLGSGLVHGVRMRHVRWGGTPNWALGTWGRKSAERGAVGIDTEGKEVDGGGGSRASWGKNVPYAEYPCPDCHIERDLGDDPPVPVTVSDGDRSAPRGPECQAWQCSAEGAGQPVMYCMRTAAHDAWYPAGKGKDKYVFYTNNPMVWRRDWFARWREVGRGAAYRGFEPTIQASAEWNKLPGYVIARGMGLFQHKRLDRGKDPVQPACWLCKLILIILFMLIVRKM